MHINFIEKKAFDLNLKSLVQMVKERKFDPTKKDLVVIVVFLLCFMALFGVMQKLRLDSLRSERAKIERAMDQKTTAGGQTTVVNSSQVAAFLAYDARSDWSSILDAVASDIPPEVSLRSLTADAQKRMVEVVGVADDHTSVASTLTSLKGVKVCRQVDLISSAVVTSEETGAQIVFTIQCMI